MRVYIFDIWRAGGTGDATRRVPRCQFESVDDLLLVPGMDYATYARIRPLVTADTYQHTNVNPLAAPLAQDILKASQRLGLSVFSM